MEKKTSTSTNKVTPNERISINERVEQRNFSIDTPSPSRRKDIASSIAIPPPPKKKSDK